MVEDIVDYVLSRPVEHRTLYVGCVLFAIGQHLPAAIGVIFRLAVLACTLRVEIVFEIIALGGHFRTAGTFGGTDSLNHNEIVLYLIENIVDRRDAL